MMTMNLALRHNASIVIPTYNKSAHLEQTLRRLVGQKRAPEFEVIVVDDCSEDATSGIIETLRTDYSLRYVRNSANMGRSKARNIGLAEAQGDIVIFLDDDWLVNDTFVYHHVHSGGPGKIVLGTRWEFSENDGDLGSALSDSRGRCQKQQVMQMLEAIFRWPLRGDAPLAWFNFITGNISTWREDVLAVGGFDENFSGWGGEDTELGYRMRSADMVYIYQPQAASYHLTHPRNPRQPVEIYDNMRYFYHKHKTREVELLLPFITGRISFQFYWAEATRNADTTTALFEDDYYRALRDDLLLASDILGGCDIVLAISPEVTMRDREPGIVVVTRLDPSPEGHPWTFRTTKEYQGIERELLLRIDGRAPLSHIIAAIGGESTSASAKIRGFASELLAAGMVIAIT